MHGSLSHRPPRGGLTRGALKAGPSCTICKIVRIFAETNLTPHIMARYINPFTDWGFKHIFGQEITKDLLISFLNDLFEGEFCIASLEFKNNEHIGLTEDARKVIFDIYCTTNEGRHLIIEMQNRMQEHFIDRALYYSSRAIITQGQKGEWDYELMPVYTICFLNFEDAHLKERKFRTDLVLADRDTGQAVTDHLRIVYLTLPLFTKKEHECNNDFERWIYVLKNMNVFERMPFMAKNAVFRKLAEISDITALSKEEHEKYDESIKILRDNYATFKFAIKEGHDKGRAEGRIEGRAEGRAEGQTKEKKQIAQNMLKEGMAVNLICKMTGLDEQEVLKLKDE